LLLSRKKVGQKIKNIKTPICYGENIYPTGKEVPIGIMGE